MKWDAIIEKISSMAQQMDISAGSVDTNAPKIYVQFRSWGSPKSMIHSVMTKRYRKCERELNE